MVFNILVTFKWQSNIIHWQAYPQNVNNLSTETIYKLAHKKCMAVTNKVFTGKH